MSSSEKYVVTTRHAHIYCMVCSQETRLFSKRYPAEGPILDVMDYCEKCDQQFYLPFTPREWEGVLKHSRVTRNRVYPCLKSFFREWGTLEFYWSEPSGSIIRKANLRMARDREISEEEKTTCPICLEPKPDYQGKLFNFEIDRKKGLKPEFYI